ncbi:protein phosphatase 1 regulatory subunit 7 [Leucosporidium creatinivorum]|uniref:Protein phosphatase 1 regulatory subunit 7 n=1 Tax=Leucosporidium creatinivorum TaxID=106004 RepID=A0A1Y2EPP6_9BASI|nr:protein phosphatase 1 regulatory subunit 7 [Leucosporidium creatinivorum]
MSRPLEPKGELSLPAGLTTNTSSSNPEQSPPSDGAPTPPSDNESHEPFANLKMDERHFEDSKKRDERKAQLVMGPPLGAEQPPAGNNNETVIDGQVLAENEEILADLPDDATDLELTHLRLRSLRGLGLERFAKVQRISLRQNLLTSLSFTPTPVASTSEEGHTLSEPTTSTEIAAPTPADEPDEDELDDEDAKKKEDEFPYHEHRKADSAESVWPLRGLKELEEIDLYDNSLKSVKGLEDLPSLTSLDLSFNLLRSISPLDDDSPNSPYAYPSLDHLYLIQNKLSKIEGVRHRTSLTYLEYGGNRIRTIENLPVSSNLRSLFLGKNKITKIEGLEGLTGLRTLSIQSNRLTKIEGLETLTDLDELYLSHNGLTKVEGLEHNTKLTTLDIGHNKIDSAPAEELAHLVNLEEFWANDNLLTTLPVLTSKTHPNLTTIYLEGNPLQKEMGTAYKRRIMLECPQVKQIDATFVRQG